MGSYRLVTTLLWLLGGLAALGLLFTFLAPSESGTERFAKRLDSTRKDAVSAGFFLTSEELNRLRIDPKQCASHAYLAWIEKYGGNQFLNRDQRRLLTDVLSGRNRTDVETGLRWVDTRRASIDELARATASPHCVFRIDFDHGRAPAFTELLSGGAALSAKSVLDALRGRFDDAWSALLAGSRLAQHVGSQQVTTAGFVRSSVETDVLQAMLRVLELSPDRTAALERARALIGGFGGEGAVLEWQRGTVVWQLQVLDDLTAVAAGKRKMSETMLAEGDSGTAGYANALAALRKSPSVRDATEVRVLDLAIATRRAVENEGRSLRRRYREVISLQRDAARGVPATASVFEHLDPGMETAVEVYTRIMARRAVTRALLDVATGLANGTPSGNIDTVQFDPFTRHPIVIEFRDGVYSASSDGGFGERVVESVQPNARSLAIRAVYDPGLVPAKPASPAKRP